MAISIAPADSVRTMPTRMVRSAPAAVPAPSMSAAPVIVHLTQLVITSCHPFASRHRLPGRRVVGNATEHRRRHQAGAVGIVEIEQAADQLARGLEPRDDRAI